MKIAVVVTSYEDLRIEATLSSLSAQTRRPDAVVVTDGSRDDEKRRRIADLSYRFGAHLVHEAGSSVARARNLALDALEPDIDAVAFLDTDQTAPPTWLGALEEGLTAGLGWVGGPTRPAARLALLVLKEQRLYAAARKDPTRIPMGNSLWRVEVFERAGRFDERLSGGGEDWDLALRASAAGYTGALVEDALVEHDLRGTGTTTGALRKQFRYDVGGAMAYLKNRRLARRAATRYPRIRFHWTDLFAPFSKALAVVVALWRLGRA